VDNLWTNMEYCGLVHPKAIQHNLGCSTSMTKPNNEPKPESPDCQYKMGEYPEFMFLDTRDNIDLDAA
jgi:hypothetical protein